MFRRAVNILVIVGLIAGHWADVSHSHAGMTAEARKQHDATPHVHLGSAHLGHSHSHHHGGHQHSHPPRIERKGTSPEKNDVSQTCGAKHDEDSIYVAPQGANPIAPAGKDGAKQVPQSTHAYLLSVVIIAENDWRLSNAAAWPPPEKSLDDSKLYLTLRNLRI